MNRHESCPFAFFLLILTNNILTKLKVVINIGQFCELQLAKISKLLIDQSHLYAHATHTHNNV